MPPNPTIVLRDRPARGRSEDEDGIGPTTSLPAAIIICTVVAISVVTLSSTRQWLQSGCGVESLLILYGSVSGNHIFKVWPPWKTLATLNFIFALASTSWLIYGGFVAICYVASLITCLVILLPTFIKWKLRTRLQRFSIAKNKLAFTDFPALIFDVGISGLIVLRGLTISLHGLSIEAHGIEIGLKLTEDVELAIYMDEIVIELFRRVKIGEVYAILKSSELQEHLDERREHDQDLSAQKGLEAVSAVNVDEKSHNEPREDILNSSPLAKSRKQAEKSTGNEAARDKSSKEMRAAICANLQDFSSLPSAPSRTVEVSALLDLIPTWLRRFVARAPFFLRLVLMPMSYFHPTHISSVSAAGSGQRLSTLIQQEIFQFQKEEKEKIQKDIQRLEEHVSDWLEDANICLEYTDIDGITQVPLKRGSNIIANVRCAAIMAFRTVAGSDEIDTSAQLGGADATIAVPMHLLPHHEHLMPPEATEDDKKRQADAVSKAGEEGFAQKVQAENELSKLDNDYTEIVYSVHARLPLYVDQSLLDFINEIAKEATKIIGMEQEDEGDENQEDEDRAGRIRKKWAGRAKGIRNNIKGVAKKAAIEVDNQWTAKLVGKLAARLADAQGDVGYSGEIPIALHPYRGTSEVPWKMLA